MKIRIIKKILASLLAISTIGITSGVASANPRKHSRNRQNIYDLKTQSCGSGQSDDEILQNQKKENENQMFQLACLLNKSFWQPYEWDKFLKICLNFSDNNLLEGCDLKTKLQVTDMLTRCSHLKDCQEWIAEILQNFSYWDFFKEYSLSQRIEITDALIECLGSDAAKTQVVWAFSNLGCDGFFKDYPTKQKVKIAKTLIRVLSEKKEFNGEVVYPLIEFSENPDIWAKLDNNEQRLCLEILKKS